MTDAYDDSNWSRRMLLGAALTVAVAPDIVAAAGAKPAAPVAPVTLTPLDAVRLQLKMMASLTDAYVPWFYTGRIYAVRGATPPLHLFDFEGTENYWVRKLPDDRWSVASSTLTFFRDAVTGAWLDRFDNPLTQRTVDVGPNVLRSRPGNAPVWSAEGMAFMGRKMALKASVHRGGNLLWMTTSRGFAGGPQPSMEAQSMFGDTREIDNPKLASAMAHFSSTTFSPWLRWMDSAGVVGHLIWHAAGRKIESNAQMPADYVQRAENFGSRHFLDPETDPPPPEKQS